jgi:ParB family chromosome partitioning protein
MKKILPRTRIIYLNHEPAVVLVDLPISQIEENPLRIAIDTSSESLADSLSLVGQLAPITVRAHPSIPDHYQIIFGNRRFKAAEKLGWKTISAKVVPASDSEVLTMAICENLDREDFTDFEKAWVIEKLHATTRKTYTQIAEMIGKSPAFVSQHIAMLHLFSEEIGTEEERARVLSKLTEKHARVLSKIEDNESRWNTAKMVVAGNLCVRELSKLAGSGKRHRNVSGNSKSAIREIISEMVGGLNSSDLRPCFNVISDKNFTMFSRFPPYTRMDKDSAKEHIYEILHVMDGFKEKISDLDIHVFGNFAYASMYVSHRLNLEGKSIRTRARATIIFAKENGWKMIHEHWSPLGPHDVIGPEESRKIELHSNPVRKN